MANKKRNLALTIVVVLGFIGSTFILLAGILLIAAPAVTAEALGTISIWYGYYLLANGIATIATLIGIWKLKKWGLFGYAGVFAANQIILLITGQWGLLSLFLPALILGISLKDKEKFE